MDIYPAGTAVTLTIPVADKSGNALAAMSISYRVLKHDGTQLLGATPLDYAGEDAVVVIPPELNMVAALDPMAVTYAQVDSLSVREVRVVELTAVLEDNLGSMTIAKRYAIEPTDTLIAGLNSFQTFAQAELTALDVPNIPSWDSASEDDKIAAMIEARSNICQLRFNLLNSNINWGQDNLNFVPEGTYPTPYSGQAMFMFNGNLALMTPAQFVKLPPRFQSALRKAQVAEASAVLGGDPINASRQQGLILETVGEVKQMYRTSKVLDMPVSKHALKYLSPFVSFAKRLGRG